MHYKISHGITKEPMSRGYGYGSMMGHQSSQVDEQLDGPSLVEVNSPRYTRGYDPVADEDIKALERRRRET